jgi:hypothetical protein
LFIQLEIAPVFVFLVSARVERTLLAARLAVDDHGALRQLHGSNVGGVGDQGLEQHRLGRAPLAQGSFRAGMDWRTVMSPSPLFMDNVLAKKFRQLQACLFCCMFFYYKRSVAELCLALEQIRWKFHSKRITSSQEWVLSLFVSCYHFKHVISA